MSVLDPSYSGQHHSIEATHRMRAVQQFNARRPRRSVTRRKQDPFDLALKVALIVFLVSLLALIFTGCSAFADGVRDGYEQSTSSTTSSAPPPPTTTAPPTTTRAAAATTAPATTTPRPTTTTPAPVVVAPPAELPPDPPAPPVRVHYPNCSAVKAAGAAPIRAGEPGYSRKLDRDGDGIACEK